MVRRDEDGSPEWVGNPSTRRGDSAGVSPVPVGRDAPGSRLPVRGEIRGAEAERQKPRRRRQPCTGEQARGPQHEVKPAASTQSQSEGRAAHVTAKATPVARERPRAAGLGGVRGAARVQGSSGNTRDPSARPWSRQGGSSESKTKSSSTQRESEGVVVPTHAVRAAGTNVATKNATGGKGLWVDRAHRAGKRKGMAGKTGPNDPGGRRPRDNVRELQRRLWAAAKQAPGRRFHFLQRWPSQRAMQRIRQRVKELTPPSAQHRDLREVIAKINPVVRGWGQYFRTGNAAKQFVQIDRYVVDRLRRKRKERHLRPGEMRRWTREVFEDLGLCRLRGTICFPERPFWQNPGAIA